MSATNAAPRAAAHVRAGLAAALLCSLVAACDGGSQDTTGTAGSGGTGGNTGTAGSGGAASLVIVPGKSVGPAALEMTFAEVKAVLGEPSLTLASSRVGFVQYEALGIEMAVTTPSPTVVEEDAIIIAIGVSKAEGFSGLPLVGQARAEVEATLGAPSDEVGPIAYYPTGASVEWSDTGTAVRVAVTPEYTNAPDAPEMTPAP